MHMPPAPLPPCQQEPMQQEPSCKQVPLTKTVVMQQLTHRSPRTYP